MKVIVIGGGASGFFAAINIAQKHPNFQVTILEKTDKLLSKVKISGGGRCNVTNDRSSPAELVKFYPRGHKKLHSVFKEFSTEDMKNWLHDRGVATNAEPDLRVFPSSNSSQTIIDLFLSEAKRLKVNIINRCRITDIAFEGNNWVLSSKEQKFQAHKLVIATGSSSQVWNLLEKKGLKISPPIPSLFTFNIKDERIEDLQGLSIKNVQAKIVGSKINTDGGFLFTHWGMSGPAILKLSAWAAPLLHEKNYQFQIILNFINQNAETAKSQILNYKNIHPKRQIVNYPLFDLQKRHWKKLATFCGIQEASTYENLSKKQLNKLVEELTQGMYNVNGKSTFKEEFVTCGGVSLEEIDLKTFACKKLPNLYLCGEALNIDALTGGFNFQACWSTAWIISENINNG